MYTRNYYNQQVTVYQINYLFDNTSIILVSPVLNPSSPKTSNVAIFSAPSILIRLWRKLRFRSLSLQILDSSLAYFCTPNIVPRAEQKWIVVLSRMPL